MAEVSHDFIGSASEGVPPSLLLRLGNAASSGGAQVSLACTALRSVQAKC